MFAMFASMFAFILADPFILAPFIRSKLFYTALATPLCVASSFPPTPLCVPFCLIRSLSVTRG